MSTHILESKVRFFKDVDGVLSIAKDEDSVESIVIDWTDPLDGDTISSASFDASGVTIDSSSNTTTTTTATISKSGGHIDIDIVTAGGLTLVKRIKIYEAVR